MFFEKNKSMSIFFPVFAICLFLFLPAVNGYALQALEITQKKNKSYIKKKVVELIAGGIPVASETLLLKKMNLKSGGIDFSKINIATALNIARQIKNFSGGMKLLLYLVPPTDQLYRSNYPGEKGYARKSFSQLHDNPPTKRMLDTRSSNTMVSLGIASINKLTQRKKAVSDLHKKSKDAVGQLEAIQALAQVMYLQQKTLSRIKHLFSTDIQFNANRQAVIKDAGDYNDEYRKKYSKEVEKYIDAINTQDGGTI